MEPPHHVKVKQITLDSEVVEEVEEVPTLNPVGHQSTNCMVRLVLIVATEAFTSFGTTSPRYIMQHAMYLP